MKKICAINYHALAKLLVRLQRLKAIQEKEFGYNLEQYDLGMEGTLKYLIGNGYIEHVPTELYSLEGKKKFLYALFCIPKKECFYLSPKWLSNVMCTTVPKIKSLLKDLIEGQYIQPETPNVYKTWIKIKFV